MSPPTSLSGALTALVTPFSADGASIDSKALDALIESQLEGGITGLIPCGTTGEAPTLSDDEKAVVIRRAAQITKGRVPVIAGVGSFSTRATITAAQHVLEAGADAIMLVMPYYNRPSQAG